MLEVMLRRYLSRLPQEDSEKKHRYHETQQSHWEDQCDRAQDRNTHTTYQLLVHDV